MSNYLIHVDAYKEDLTEGFVSVKIHGPSAEAFFYIDIANVDMLEDLEAEIESIASQIRDFRMKNFPESTEIE